MVQKKLYLLLRKDLGTIYSMVQAGHAIAEFALNGNTAAFKIWGNGTLVYLGVPDLQSLEFWQERLKVREKEFVCFYEPDINNELTTIACIDDGKIFKKLRLA